jgi:hypothetical protein
MKSTRSVLAGLSVGLLASLCPLATSARASAASVPFTDPNVTGTLTLCNQKGQSVTSGSLYDIPFIWKVISSSPAPSGYKEAYLAVAQPIEHVDPSGWFSYQMTSSTVFTNSNHPVSQLTYADQPLLQPYLQYPPYWEGYYQLRMFFTSPQQSPWTTSYPAAVIQVSGSSWTLIQGGGGSCRAGSGVSVEADRFPTSELDTPRTVPLAVQRTLPTVPGVPTTSAPRVTPTTGARSSSSPSSSSGSGSGVAAPATSGKSSGSGGGDGALVGLLIGVVAVILAGGGTIWFRRRSRSRITAEPS